MPGFAITETKDEEQHCEECGEEIEEWRQEHSDLCSECGPPLCRYCGTDVRNMDNTSNGGVCIPCSIDEYGHEA